MPDNSVQTFNTGGLKPRSLRNLVKLGLILLAVVAVTSIFYGGFIVGKSSVNLEDVVTSTPQIAQNQQSSLLPVQGDVKQPPITNYINQMMRIYPSLNRRYSFYIYPADSLGKCLYGIRDKEGMAYDISSTLGSSTIDCFEGLGSLTSSFSGWVDEDKFLINENKEGEVKIIDIVNSSSAVYSYDTSRYQFVGANRSLKYWLFSKAGNGTVSYILLDRGKSVVLDNIQFETNDRGVLYDEVNDGFLFISRTFTGNDVSIRFDFLPMSTLNLRHLLTTEPVEAPGRGCYSEYLISQPGEIILTPGCLTVGSKYLGSDGNIHIKL